MQKEPTSKITNEQKDLVLIQLHKTSDSIVAQLRDLKIDKYEAHFEQVVPPSFMEKFLKVRGQEQPSIETAQSGNFTFFFFPSFNKKENRISDMCQAETPQESC